MKKKLFVIILALGILLSACGKAQSDSTDKTNSETTKTVKVGIIQFAEHIALDRARTGFIDELKDMGFEVEESVVNVQGDITLVPIATKKFEDDKVDIIYAIATPAAQGAKEASDHTPIIFNAVTDPLAAQLVDSNEKPGGNVTGVSDFFPMKAQLESFLEIFPDVKKLGVLYSTGEANSEAQIIDLRTVASELGLELVETGVSTTNDVAQAMASLVTKIDCYIAIQDNLASSAAGIIAKSLSDAGIPSLAGEGGPVENGILLSDGVDYENLGKEAALIAKKIIEGEKPGTIPVVFSSNIKRVVNQETAEKLNLSDNEKLFENAQIVK
ncbi:MAG: ABC transporter substrate-binding protein [Tissierellia bacterium]|nr:ABC transporter substrate-binding protein [Tissierellia bacterium]